MIDFRSGRGWRRHLLVVLGGALGVAARPTLRRARRAFIDRAVRPAVGADPVAPFREAPCYESDRDAAGTPARTTRAAN